MTGISSGWVWVWKGAYRWADDSDLAFVHIAGRMGHIDVV
jgi:hypothetical protein